MEIEHKGGCHCGAVRFKVQAPPLVHVVKCNCSICVQKGLACCIVPYSKFTLLQGEDNLTEYRFNTMVAKHTFCKTCGVESFYTPRSNPDGISVSIHCIDPGTVAGIELEEFNGQEWEASFAASDISKLSK
ncbi:hypothetical protein LOTGIDRAFT_188141 [Lottia gigantea]|uniref:CENP-V/GFA domain-containing protein n=1 Tax=Lottia gigantea TaxID=225164 RepID=V4ARY7_LOTGI|nr:hypothetical protein LOTGIDRAFT_188141 [Lottia gigantea]ESO96471.1 hypothetical protein LOTGIDRAFT_188141 [Lottia gigantea]